MKEYEVSLPEYGRRVYALGDTSLFECLARAGVMLRSPCGGAGICGKCLVKVEQGELPPSRECIKLLTTGQIDDGFRLACRCRISGDISVVIPRESLFESDTVTLMAKDNDECSAKAFSGARHPLVAIEKITFKPPSLENPVADLTQLKDAIGDREVSLKCLRKLPEAIRKGGFSVFAAMSADRLIDIWPAGAEQPQPVNYGIAIDLGTTTLAAALVDLSTGRQLATRGTLNPQVRFGEDVLSRICAQGESSDNSSDLADCALDACNTLISGLAEESGISCGQILSAAVAGNTAMQSLLLGIPAKHMGQIPFAPPFSSTLRLKSADLGLDTHPDAEVVVFPVIGGFVGGDITAGILASGLCGAEHSGEDILFVDVGTNGEIILKKGARLYAAAAAAGPAFEGAGITHGMRAGKGAIEKVVINKDGTLLYNVIGNVSPVGICGSALIDIASELLCSGILDETGRIQSSEECSGALRARYADAASLISRIVPSEKSSDTFDFVIEPGDSGRDICLTQKDVRSLQLASGAIRAAINILLKTAGMSFPDIHKIFVAGGFGNFIRRSHARRIGMLPPLPDSRIFYIGNTSLVGAKCVLLSADMLHEAEKIIGEVQFVDVSSDIEFQMEFASAMIFPGAEAADA
ncbi:MAG: DUF4445 domain-containing protein [Victivallales bacterium]|nr:DUF4445 domain-containing protein [Victivallales bacterium]